MKDETCAVKGDQIALAKGVDINVIADPAGNGVAWRLDIKTGGHGNGDKINLPKDNNYAITFSLVDNTRLGLRFDASAPMFAREGGGTACPSDISTTQIMVDSCTAKNLVVIDWNSGAPVELYYQLNFVNTVGTKKYAYDPPITNGGGGVPPMIEL